MSNISELRTLYGKVFNAHTDIIQQKATAFVDSLIYKNDIETILKGKFDNIRYCFETGKYNVSSLRTHFSATDFENVIEMINRFMSLSNLYISWIEDTNKQIEVASEAAYEEYCNEFKEDNDIWNEINGFAEDHFSQYDDLNQTLEKKKNSLNFAIATNADPETIETLKEDCERQEFKVEGALNTISDDIRILLEYNAKLIDLLNKALRKGTAAQ